MLLKTLSSIIILTFLLADGLDIQTIYTIEDGLPNNEVRSLLNQGNDKIWIGSKAGAAWYSAGEWKKDTSLTNPITAGVSSIFKDSKGNIWFGGLGKAHVKKQDQYQSLSIIDDMGLQGRVVFDFHEDEEQNIWVATTGGAALFDGSDWKTLTIADGLKHNVIHDINQAPNGDYWFATRKGGLNIYDGVNWKYLYPEKNCRKIFKDDLGNMWLGTNDGLLKYNGEDWQHYEAGKTVLPMFKGSKGFVWCIAEGKDIIRVSNQGRIIRYSDVCNGNANEIFHLAPGDESSVWAGTDQGIIVLH